MNTAEMLCRAFEESLYQINQERTHESSKHLVEKQVPTKVVKRYLLKPPGNKKSYQRITPLGTWLVEERRRTEKWERRFWDVYWIPASELTA